MIIPADGDADLFKVLSRLSTCYANFAGVSTALSSRALTLSGKVAPLSAFGDSCE